MLRIHNIRLDGIYVPVKRKKTLDATKVQALATRLGERLATDGEFRARIDGLAFRLR